MYIFKKNYIFGNFFQNTHVHFLNFSLVFEFKKLLIIPVIKKSGGFFSNIHNTNKHFLILQHNKSNNSTNFFVYIFSFFSFHSRHIFPFCCEHNFLFNFLIILLRSFLYFFFVGVVISFRFSFFTLIIFYPFLSNVIFCYYILMNKIFQYIFILF